jgi:hypothetical protein
VLELVANKFQSLCSGIRIEVVMSPSGRPAHRKASLYCARLLESYCEGCGLLIAASPLATILTVMERMHVCPVYFRYPPQQSTEIQNSCSQSDSGRQRQAKNQRL